MSTFAGRVTQRSIGQHALLNLQNNLSRLGDLQNQLSSGKAISRPSDSPTGTSSALQLRAQIGVNQQWSANAKDGLAWLGTADSTLTSALDMVNRVRNLTVQGMSTGAQDGPARQAAAEEVAVLRDGLLALANTRYLDRPIFAGTAVAPEAYDSAGNYLGGTANAVTRTVGDGAVVPVSMVGPDVFQASGAAKDVFAIVADIAGHLTSDPSQLGADLSALDAAKTQISSSLSTIGARYNRVDTMRQAADDRVLNLKSSLSGVEDIDLPATIVNLNMQQIAYQSALSATAKTVQPSLLDFLR